MNNITLKNNLSSHFILVSYPDGQHAIELNLDKLNIKEPVKITCRIRDFKELEVLFCLVSALRKNDFLVLEIEFIYIFGLRSDRAFKVGQPNYFRDVLKPILELLKCDLIFFSPHNSHQVKRFYYPIMDTAIYIGGDESVKNWQPLLIGWFKKTRGNEIKVDLVIKKPDIFNKSNEIVIVDDLCDGGGTFIAEAKYLKNRYPDKKLKLCVIHGLFTNGFSHLLSYFDSIECSNSYQDIDHINVKQQKVI